MGPTGVQIASGYQCAVYPNAIRLPKGRTHLHFVHIVVHPGY